MEDAVVHRCSCGVEYSRVEWHRLRRIGYMDCDLDGHLDHELRICGACGSTRALEICPRRPVPPRTE